jgi:flagellar biosynthesis protein FlhF
MQLKSYFSGTVEAAMELARKELGEDALLVNARPATPETRYLGAYEVVFGLVPRAGATFAEAAPVPAKAMAAAAGRGSYGLPSHTQSTPVAQSPAAANPQVRAAEAQAVKLPQAAPNIETSSKAIQKEAVAAGNYPTQSNKSKPSTTKDKINDAADDQFRNNIQQLRLQIGQLTATVRPSREATQHVDARKVDLQATPEEESSPPSATPQTERAHRKTRQKAEPVIRTQRHVTSESFVATDPSLGRPSATSAVVALIGPPGAGKTTTLVKLAVRYGLALRRSVHILTTDTHRIAAADQLRSLAAILGVGCEVVETTQALEQALERNLGKGLILIDTPGLAARDLDQSAELMEMLSSRSEIDTHLVLPASMKFADMLRIAKQYAGFQPGKLLFTRMDETTHYGALVRAAASLALPVSFLTNGQEIPDDLEEASAARLTSSDNLAIIEAAEPPSRSDAPAAAPFAAGLGSRTRSGIGATA